MSRPSCLMAVGPYTDAVHDIQYPVNCNALRTIWWIDWWSDDENQPIHAIRIKMPRPEWVSDE